MSRRQLCGDMQRDHCLEGDHTYYSEHGDAFNCSNFLDLDCLSSSGNSCEEEPFERYFFFFFGKMASIFIARKVHRIRNHNAVIPKHIYNQNINLTLYLLTVLSTVQFL